MIISVDSQFEHCVVSTDTQIRHKANCNQLDIFIVVSQSCPSENSCCQGELRMNDEESAFGPHDQDCHHSEYTCQPLADSSFCNDMPEKLNILWNSERGMRQK